MSDLLNMDDILGGMDDSDTTPQKVKKGDTSNDKGSPDRAEKKPIKVWKVVLVFQTVWCLLRVMAKVFG